MKNPIYKISAGSNFFNELALGMLNKASLTCKLKNNIVILPTKLACHTLRDTFKQLKIPSPIVQPIGNLNLIAPKSLIISPPLDKMALVNKISKVILQMNINNFNSIYAATELAEYFADLFNRLELYQINLTNLLEIIREDLAIHKQQIIELLEVLIHYWVENYHLTRAGYNNILINEFTKNIGNKNLIIAGVNSSLPAINNLLLKAVNQPNSHIVLYGLDEHLTTSDWKNVKQNHPQYNFKSFLAKLNVDPMTIKAWHNDDPSSLFISQALKPAKSCSNWHELEVASSRSFKVISLPDQHIEAKTITEIAKSEETKSIMIVTSDDSLMVKLMLHLNAANIDANIIRDHPLDETQASIWLKLCLNYMLEKFSLTALLGLLKHQFSIIDPLELETLIRNKNFFGNNVFDIGQEDELFKKIQQTTRELKEFGNFKDLSNQHIKFVEEFANQDIWQGEVGKELQAFIEQLSSALENTAPISLKEYSLLFNHFLKSTYYREESLAKRITLLKPIDARLHSADIVILAGMNQDTWPTKTRPDPYFNPHLLDKIGFPLSSQAVGEEIYDFQCLAQAKEVIITRPEKINGTITIASPLVLRLQILSRNSINATYKLPMLEVLKLMKDKEPPLTSINYRPIQLSVTQIEKLIFNPYHIYVDLILKLKKLPLLIKELSALDFGNFIHRSLAIYHNNRNDTLINAGQRALKELKLNQPSIKMLWWPRFLRIAHWFITHENTEAKIFLEDFGKIKIGDNFTMIAIADRLEFLANSSINIIDYKTGRLSSAKSITTGKTLQLLLEAIIAQNGGFSCQVRNSSINALEYIQLSGGENPATILSIDLDSKIIEQTKAYLEELIKQYQDPKTPYYYTKKKTLNYCEYEHLSR